MASIPPAFAIHPKVLLAPMAGVTDAPFRRQAIAFGCRYVVSEMVASEFLAAAQPEAIRRTAAADPRAPLVIQLAGREARWMARGAALARDAGADVIDINMGCPAKKVTSGWSGAALMREPDLALSLVEAVVAAAGGARVTLKMRLGWDETRLNAADIARRAAAAGIGMIVVHGRTRRQFYQGEADWGAVAPVAAAVSIPVIVNGDIASAAQARSALKASGAAGVMVGRAALGRPWLPGAIAAALERGGEAVAPPIPDIEAGLLALCADAAALYGASLGVRIARKHVAAAIDALPGLDPARRRRARADICRLETPAAVAGALRALFAEAGQAPAPRMAA